MNINKCLSVILIIILVSIFIVSCTPTEAVYVRQPVNVNVVSGNVSMVGTLTSNVTLVSPIPLPITGLVSVSSGNVSIINTPTANVTVVNPFANPVQVYVQSENYTNIITYPIAISEGLLPTHISVSRFGFTASVTTAQRDIWLGTGTYVFPTVAQQMRLVSDSVQDKAGGTGAVSVEIEYLDGSYNQHIETVSLNGTVAVNTVATNIFRVNDLRCVSVGTSQNAVGTVSIGNLAGTVFYRYIAPGFTASRGTIYTVPAGKTLYIESFYIGCGQLTAVQTMRATLRANYDVLTNTILTPGLFFMPFAEVVQTNGSVDRLFTVPIRIPATCDVKISIFTDAGTGNAEGSFRGWIE